MPGSGTPGSGARYGMQGSGTPGSGTRTGMPGSGNAGVGQWNGGAGVPSGVGFSAGGASARGRGRG
eukprot:3728384-Rhodomonas_salina.1